jgi:hypothetical protein
MQMSHWNRIAATALLVILNAAAQPAETARKTPFTTNEPVEIPGTVLDGGQYVIRLVETEVYRNVLQVFETVQVWNADETQLLSTILTMPNYDRPTTDKTVFTFFDRGPKQAKALRLWFAPGRNYGQEFVYPTAQAVELAKSVGRSVLSMPPELPGNLGQVAKMVIAPAPEANKVPFIPPLAVPMKPVAPPLVARKPAGHPIESRARVQQKMPVATTLPKTGSYIPLLAALGMMFLIAGTLLRALSARLEGR